MPEPSGAARARRLPAQILILVLFPLLWAVWPRAELWALAACYLLAWVALNAFLGRGGSPRVSLPLPPLLLLAALLLTVPTTALVRTRYDFRWNEGLRGLGTHLEDRLRLEDLPAVAPPVVFSDHPQTFYLHAPGAGSAALSLGPGEPEIAGRPLGHGLFRADYDPRVHGAPPGEAVALDARLVVDGRAHRRSLRSVRPEAHPRWLASDPARGLACTVSEETDELFLLSREGLEARVPTADGPTDCAFTAEGLAVSHRYSPELWLYPLSAGAAPDHRLVPASRQTLAPFQVRLAAAPGGDLLAVATAGPEPGIWLLEGSSGETRYIPLPFAPDWLAFGRGPGELVVSTRAEKALYRLTRGPEEGLNETAAVNGWRLSTPLPLGRQAVTLARRPDGRSLLVAVTDYRPDGEDHRGNHFVQDQLLTVDLESWQVAGSYLTARRSALQDQAGNVDRGASPMGLAPRPDGSTLVAFAGTEEVWILGADPLAPPRILDGLDLDLVAPHGVADLGDGYWAATSPAGGAMAVYREVPDSTMHSAMHSEMVEFVGVAPPDAELDAAGPGTLAWQALDVRLGERAFYEATRAGIACQSCHLHAGSDESRHEIGQKPLLPTLTTRGIAGTAPYLRDGSFPRVRDLDTHLSQTLYRGFRRDFPERRLYLETFVESQPREVGPRRFAARDLELERAGLDAFVEARCTLCHTLPAFTNLSQHPVRSLFPDYGADLDPVNVLDTPSLLGLASKSHFLQDGRAHDLEAVLTEHNRSNRHGDSAALGEEDRSALAHFLLSL